MQQHGGTRCRSCRAGLRCTWCGKPFEGIEPSLLNTVTVVTAKNANTA